MILNDVVITGVFFGPCIFTIVGYLLQTKHRMKRSLLERNISTISPPSLALIEIFICRRAVAGVVVVDVDGFKLVDNDDVFASSSSVSSCALVPKS